MSGWGRIDGKDPFRIVPFTRWQAGPEYQDSGLLESGPDVPVLFTMIWPLEIHGYDQVLGVSMYGSRN